MNFPEKLVQLRRGENLSQEKLAEILGISRQALAKWEQGEALPEIENLLSISNYFRVSVDSLLRENTACAESTLKRGSPAETSIVPFLLRSKRACYAASGAEVPSSRIASHDLRYSEGEMLYYDSYLGGEKFAGEEAVWAAGQPVWAMNYYGQVLAPQFNGDFLKEALGLVEEAKPYRGPLHYRAGEFTYHCMVSGDFAWFQGNEEIFWGNQKVYACLFHGGELL